MFKNIMIPVDMRHRNEAERSIATAVDLARHFGANVSILTVWRPLGHHSLQELPEDHKSEFEAFVAEKSAQQGMTFEPIFEHADIASDRITKVAQERSIDLIVMGTHDPRFTDYFFGSNAAHVALHAECAVMIVR